MIVYGRTSFGTEQLQQRARDNDDWIGKREAKLEAVKKQLWKNAQDNNWKIRSADGVDRPMVELRFYRIQ